MLDACVNIIVRNGDDFIAPVLRAVRPYAKRVRVGLDSRSTDKTKEILKVLGVEVVELEIKNPKTDLVALRNKLLDGVEERYVWVVDSDEYYPKKVVEELWVYLGYADVYTLNCYAPWSTTTGHKSSSKPEIPRFFINDGRRWTGRFGKERLHKQGDYIVNIPLRYIHLTHFKKDDWRKELGQDRVADGKFTYPLPDWVTKELESLGV